MFLTWFFIKIPDWFFHQILHWHWLFVWWQTSIPDFHLYDPITKLAKTENEMQRQLNFSYLFEAYSFICISKICRLEGCDVWFFDHPHSALVLCTLPPLCFALFWFICWCQLFLDCRSTRAVAHRPLATTFRLLSRHHLPALRASLSAESEAGEGGNRRWM